METRQGENKNSVGNVEAKELICITHGHELKGEGILMGDGVQGRGGKRGEKWENCNSIINKMYFKKRNNGVKSWQSIGSLGPHCSTMAGSQESLTIS